MHDTPKYLSEFENLKQINEMVLGQHKSLFHAFECNRVDPGFASKIYIVYKANGKDSVPSIIGQVKIVDWFANVRLGPQLTVEDMATGRTMTIGVVPTKLWEYDVFMSCAPYAKLRWDMLIKETTSFRSLLFTLLVRTKTKSDQYTKGVTYCDGIKPFKNLYPNLPFVLSYY